MACKLRDKPHCGQHGWDNNHGMLPEPSKAAACNGKQSCKGSATVQSIERHGCKNDPKAWQVVDNSKDIDHQALASSYVSSLQRL